MMRLFLSTLAAFLLTCLSHNASAALPAAGANQVSLTPSELAAVVREAQRRAREEDPLDVPWQSLDKSMLARLLRMSEFAGLKDDPKTVLINQAAAWELMPFERPSQAQALWASWYPERGIDKAVDPADKNRPSLRAPQVLDPDAHWGKVAGAQVALLHCLPIPAWYVHHMNPMLWTIDNGAVWNAGATSDFGKCVRKQSDTDHQPWDSSPDTVRGKASADVLEAVLSNYLLAHGCEGKGPDSCLVLTHALLALSPDSERLIAVLKRLEPEIAAMNAQQRLIFVTAKLPVLIAHPQAWPSAEMTRALAEATRLTITLHDILGRHKHYMDRRAYANPWPFIEAAPASEPVLMALGRDYAAAPGCELPKHAPDTLPQAFWIGYGLAKVATEKSACDVFSAHVKLTDLYGRALAGDAAPLAVLLPVVKDAGPLRDQLLDIAARACPTPFVRTAPDPWGACNLQAVKLAQVDAENKRKAEEAAAAAAAKAAEVAASQLTPEQLQTCSAETIAAVGAHFKVANFSMRNEGDGVLMAAACKRWPAFPDLEIAALAYDAGVNEEKQQLTVLLDRRTGKIVSALRQTVQEDATMSLRALSIDTARYQLAPGVLAFAVDLIIDTPAHYCATHWYGDQRSLYVREQGSLRAVLSGLTLSDSYIDESTHTFECGDGAENQPTPVVINTNNALAIAPSRSKGYADLVLISKIGPEGGKPTIQKRLMHYDGARYQLPQ
ncbi:MAG: hypothetical protein ACJ8GW_05250 [Massilia sp.]